MVSASGPKNLRLPREKMLCDQTAAHSTCLTALVTMDGTACYEFSHRPSVLPPLDAQRNLTPFDREPLRIQLRCRGHTPERGHRGARGDRSHCSGAADDQPFEARADRASEY